MRTRLAMIGAAGLGAGLSYILDPDRGGRRRALARDKVVRAAHKTGDAVGKTSRDVANRTRGLVADLRSRLRTTAVGDDVLARRLRARIGLLTSHPGSIEVGVEGGRVTLTGPVLAGEVDRLLKVVRAVRGVEELDSRLEVHAEPGHVPELQGVPARRPASQALVLARQRWSPATRLLIGLGGVAVTVWGLERWRHSRWRPTPRGRLDRLAARVRDLVGSIPVDRVRHLVRQIR